MELECRGRGNTMSPAVSALLGDEQAAIRHPRRCVVLLRRLANERYEALLTEVT